MDPYNTWTPRPLRKTLYLQVTKQALVLPTFRVLGTHSMSAVIRKIWQSVLRAPRKASLNMKLSPSRQSNPKPPSFSFLAFLFGASLANIFLCFLSFVCWRKKSYLHYKSNSCRAATTKHSFPLSLLVPYLLVSSISCIIGLLFSLISRLAAPLLVRTHSPSIVYRLTLLCGFSRLFFFLLPYLVLFLSTDACYAYVYNSSFSFFALVCLFI